jgi:hypothetical protein
MFPAADTEFEPDKIRIFSLPHRLARISAPIQWVPETPMGKRGQSVDLTAHLPLVSA